MDELLQGPDVHTREMLANQSTTELMQGGFDEAKELLRIEIALAKEEAIAEIRGLRASTVAFVVCAVCTLVAMSALVASIVVATSYVVGLIASGALLVAAVAFGYAGRKKLPTHPMEKTRRRLMQDARTVKEGLT